MKIIRFALLVGLGLVAVAALTPVHAFAAPSASLVVNSINDTDDGSCNAAHCSLREAINASNASVGVMDTITFNIPGGGVKTISPLTALPNLFDTVVIDGYTQPGSSPNTLAQGDNAVLNIELDGQLAPINTSGLTLDGDNSIVRGLVINRFNDSGLFVYSDFNVIEGNFIGTNTAGSAALANYDGIDLCGASIKNLIGGNSPAARNLISGNTGAGIGMSRCADLGSGNSIQGNYIGTNRNGTVALPNANGVSLTGGSHVVGGLNAAARNLISGNAYGIVFSGVTDSIISANFIGTTADGKHALPNQNGVYFQGSAGPGFSVGNRIGGVTKAEANRIAFNHNAGVDIGDSASEADVKNTLEGNSIFANGGLALDLGHDSVTTNDTGDGDSGPNLLQNFPLLTRATSALRQIKGRLDSTPNTTFTLEFFKNPSCDASGNGEGKKFLGRTTVTTDSAGSAHFTFHSPKAFAIHNALTATATDNPGNTSEFSACRVAR